MRVPSHPEFIVVAAIALALGLAVPASAGTFYQWETDDGGIAFTDDEKRIPARYRDEARALATKKLDDFERFTPMAPSRPAPYAARMDERLHHLRDLNARMASADAVGAPQPGPQGLAFRSGRYGQDIEAYVDPTHGGEPVIVETVRSRPAGSPVTRHITIVRQGERILSVIKPEQLHSTPRPVDERDLEN